MSLVYVGLGGNLGDRMARLQEALRRMAPYVKLDRVSTVYATDPVGFIDQGEFLNAVVRGETSLSPEELLARLKTIENEMGRSPSPRNGPREIDLDVLLYDGVVRAAPPPELPHPRMHERAFVLRPLADIDPGVVIPGRGAARDLLASLTGQGTNPWPQKLDLP